ncbi:hypothetical protein MM326_13690 [Alkalihalobacillus sp. LMS6]|jgi:hypothetical protein|uniref:hypothetical protein n=1 Tax=Alkalihalobacillus sp. LMS6 TaxID=2924034 RepID=UPI0020D14688|nr:hypothetical protein [Alkalihalobacillus sp. LMS6]UTR05160.1 hypothetical protein MM326_13690 [Alkalihalobacillus sp. LMS6]
MIELSRWFVTESKSFAGYGDYTPKLRFWAQFPMAYAKFMYYTAQDKIRGVIR